jgi:hypothetical protein
MERVSDLEIDLQLLDSLTSSEEELRLDSCHEGSLAETSRRQNLRGSLTNITDSAFEFFILLDSTISSLETTANIDLYASNFHTFIKGCLLANAQLKASWLALFTCKVPETCTEEHADNLMAKHLEHTDVVYEDVVNKYLNMASGDLRRSYLRDMKAKKQEAHRKQVKINSSKNAQVCNFVYLLQDQSSERIASHRRLQSEITTSSDFLLSFTKTQLILLGNSYNVTQPQKLTKAQMIQRLNAVIVQADNMHCPDALSGGEGGGNIGGG